MEEIAITISDGIEKKRQELESFLEEDQTNAWAGFYKSPLQKFPLNSIGVALLF